MNQNNGRARRRPDEVERKSSPGNYAVGMNGRSTGERADGHYADGTGSADPSRRLRQHGPRAQRSAVREPTQGTGPTHHRGSETLRNTDGKAASARIVSGRRRSYRASPGALTPVTERKQMRAVRAAEKERKWQEDIVRVRGGVDKVMLAIILLLLCLGSLMVFSASYPVAMADKHITDSLYYVKRQLIFVGVGAVIMMLASVFPYRWYKKWGPFAAYGVSLLLLIAVLFIGKSEGEAKRWIGVGSFTIQPSELMKVSLVLILAWYIEKFKPEIDARLDRKQTILYSVVGPGVFVGAACGLILLERHLSGTIITGLVALAVMFVGGCHFGWTTLIFGAAGAICGGIFLLANPYALKRITTFTDDNADIMDEMYQTNQSIYAIGSGGLFGLGFGQSRQKYSYVSAAHTDFIFAIWCEEMGFIGGVLLVGVFIAFVWRGYVIASRAPDTFSMLTAFGITTHVGLQAFLNMCVASDVIPNTGISLPFFSYGGSSLIVLMAEMGLLLSISRQYYRKKSDLGREKVILE